MASEGKNWQKFLSYKVPSTKYGCVPFLTVYCLFYRVMKVAHPFVLRSFPVWVVCPQWLKLKELFLCPFHSTDIAPWLSQMVAGSHWLPASLAMASKVRTQYQKHGTEWKPLSWLCSTTWICFFELWISLSSNGVGSEQKTCKLAISEVLKNWTVSVNT